MNGLTVSLSDGWLHVDPTHACSHATLALAARHSIKESPMSGAFPLGCVFVDTTGPTGAKGGETGQRERWGRSAQRPARGGEERERGKRKRRRGRTRT